MTPQALLGFGFVAVTLAIFADVDATSELAQAFAWLVLFAVVYEAGPKLFTQFSTLTGAKTA